jgi:hypothetical protein
MAFRKDLAAAAQHLERALALEPTNEEIIRSAAGLLESLGRPDQAIPLGRYMTARDLGKMACRVEQQLLWAGRLDEAIVSFRTALHSRITLRPDI